jgi:hypothetical protein
VGEQEEIDQDVYICKISTRRGSYSQKRLGENQDREKEIMNEKKEKRQGNANMK